MSLESQHDEAKGATVAAAVRRGPLLCAWRGLQYFASFANDHLASHFQGLILCE